MSGTTAPDTAALPRVRLFRWFSEHPRTGDAAVIIICSLPTLLALRLSPPDHAWLGYLCMVGVAVALWWRRSHPLTVLIVTVALASFSPVSAISPSPAFFESVFGIYTLAALTRFRTALVGHVIAGGTILAVSGIGIALGLRTHWTVLPLLQPAALAAFAIGVAVRLGRARRTALEEVVALREEQAAAAERSRITAEMHDVVAHSVTVMLALAGGAAAGWEKHPARARHALDQLGSVGVQALEDMQRILRILRDNDAVLDRNLAESGHNLPSLEHLIEVFRTAGLPVALRTDDAWPPADAALATTIYRIVQEALTNALRHGTDVTQVHVSVLRTDGGFRISVVDDGRGTPMGPGVGAGIGVSAMRARAAAFAGTLHAGPRQTDLLDVRPGWHVSATLPFRSERT